jgi:hypothetical protein
MNTGKSMNAMKSHGLRCLLVCLLLVVGTSAASAAKIKCWTNKEGFRECGNVVPPEYAQQGHNELSDQGLTVSTQQRAKTDEEIEQERLEREQKEREKALADEQARRDRVLLATFGTEEDMLLSHKGKLAAIDTRIIHTEQVVVKLGGMLQELNQEAADQERGGKKVSDKTLKSMRQIKQQIAENKDFILRREEEKVELNVQFEKELDRFRMLKSQ